MRVPSWGELAPTREELERLANLTLQERALADLAGLLNTAALIVDRIRKEQYPIEHIDSVAWRTADALKIISQLSEDELPDVTITGIHNPTGYGAQLKQSGDQ
jgi:hypothetical protein